MAKKVKRLFEQFRPENYNLTLDVDRDGLTFTGTVIVSGKKVGRPSQRITFHQKGLKISSAKVIKKDKKGDIEIKVARIGHQRSFDEVRLHFDELVHAGTYTVTMAFEGSISDIMLGIYPCYYKHEGKDKRLIATQFESHHAREAFPCIDEPEAKATFDLTVIAPKGDTVLSNTPIKAEEAAAKKTATSFQTTPIMSTYLLAFVFGELHGVKGKTKDNIEVRSWATVAQPIDHLYYANSEAIKILEFFSDYFETPFPLPKFDQVALPDFESLAMENWGLVTFREVGLLADPINRSISGEQLTTLVISHEMSHQWFGNLVTMRWWDDLWLNESFASIMENVAPDRLHPDWHQWEEFATGRVLSCSHRDIYKEVQSVGVQVKHPDEISSLFDPAIVYAKGGRLISMLLDYIGEDAFRQGLKQYFKDHAYGNTNRDDLWKALSKSSGLDIESLMTPWIEKSGMPLLRIKRDNDQIKLSQKRFLLDGEDNESLWPIPLLTDVDLEPNILKTRNLSIAYNNPEIPIFNVAGSGHYVVSYEAKKDQAAVAKHIIDRTVESTSRINLINDMLLLSRLGEFSLVDMLELIQKCDDEPRDAVWSMFARTIGQAQALTDGNEEVDAQTKIYRRNLAKKWYDKLDWTDTDNDDPNTKHLRSTAIALSISGENPDAIKKALEMFNKAGNVQNLPAEQRAMIAGVAVRFGKPEYIDQLMEEYVSTSNPDVQQSINAALCLTRDKKVAKRLIEWGLSKDGVVRPQDIDHWFAYFMRNYYTRDLAWQWLEDSWDHLVATIGIKQMEYFIWYSSGPLSTPEWQKRFNKFFEPKLTIPASKRNIQIALKEIEARVEWRKREEPTLKTFFASIK